MGDGLPQRIICLTAEITEIVYLLGAGERIVGVSGYSERPPEARRKPKVGAFTEINLEKIRALTPDLILGFSDLQADIAAMLVKEGFNVLITNQRSLNEIEFAIRLVGGVIGCHTESEALCTSFRREVEAVRARGEALARRPRVFFEEWDEPLISGIRWVSEIIDIAGGQDVFEAESRRHAAAERVIDPAEALARDPEVIVASWCGKKLKRATIVERPGWEEMTAVRNAAIYEIPSADILQPGPGILAGLRKMHDIMARHQAA